MSLAALPIDSAGRPRRPRGLRAALSVLAAAALALGGLSLSTAAHAEEAADDTTVSWSVRPGDTAQGSGRPNFAYELAPGGTLSDSIIVTNRSSGPIELDVYAADGILSPDGALDLLPSGTESTELGAWVDVSTPDLLLESGQSAEVPFSVAIPADAEPGDYAAGVVASMTVGDGSGVATERRLGSRMHLRVLGDLVPGLAVTDVVLDYSGTWNPFSPGGATVTYTLENTGNTRIAPDDAITIAGPFGWFPVAASASDDVPEVLPGTSVERTVQVDSVFPLGLLAADLEVGGDVVSRDGGSAAEIPAVPAASASASTVAVPWTLLALVVVAALLVAAVVLARRRAKAGRQRDIDAAVEAALASRDGEAAGDDDDHDEDDAPPASEASGDTVPVGGRSG
ncbi:DUF916 domain-containing protein [Agromyces seonyuensis]|uniref:DUF916 domain-containing protein n=1 Tax=Agromyces seonyuensis TaxID=2662446 RepID=A0A6I4NZY5_9MICO|nr:DUF916 domain-containing protein [Agromyces seonyuensis]MWB99691.1 DUF916 domain-containing protein [Agromyces seonyuensis]